MELEVVDLEEEEEESALAASIDLDLTAIGQHPAPCHPSKVSKQIKANFKPQIAASDWN